jgi:hypothetical protein
MAHYPPLEELVAGPDRANLLEIRRSPRATLARSVLCAIIFIFVVALNFEFSEIALPASLRLMNHFSLRWLYLIPIVFAADIVRRNHNDLYVVGLSRITHQKGRLSLQYALPSLKYSDIRGIAIEQGLLGRLFDYGDVFMGTGAQDEWEVHLIAVPAPRELVRMIDSLRGHMTAQSVDNPHDD